MVFVMYPEERKNHILPFTMMNGTFTRGREVDRIDLGQRLLELQSSTRDCRNFDSILNRDHDWS
jgi:hypothetical protein